MRYEGVGKPITIGGRDWDRMTLKHYCYDPSLLPTGSPVLIALFSVDYGYWEKFLSDPFGCPTRWLDTSGGSL